MQQIKDHDLGILIARLGLAVIFIAHGWDKFQNIDGVIGFFGSLGLPAFMAYVVALLETAAGVAMFLGIYTYEAGLAIAAIMVGAIYLVKFSKGFLGGYELDLALLTSALAVAFAGPGRHTVHEWMKRRA